MNTMQRSEIEMQVVKYLLATAKEHGWTCTHVDNGDGWERVTDDDVLDEAFAADDAWLRFDKDGLRNQFVQLVFGNDGWDVIADCTCGLPEWDAVVEAVDKQLENWTEE